MGRSRNTSPGVGVWRISQVASLLYIIVAIISLFFTPTKSTFGAAFFFLLLWNVIILICLFVWYIINNSSFSDSDLFHGMYVGVTFMAALNIIAEAVVLIAESIAIKSIEGTGTTRTLYIVLAVLSAILAVMQIIYVKKAFYSKQK
ncbi:hypothetical protein WA171_006285 [Blastocystis sp. BT1]